LSLHLHPRLLHSFPTRRSSDLPKCSNGSIGRPDLRPPSNGRDWGEAHRADAFLRRSLLPPLSDPALLSAFPPVPPEKSISAVSRSEEHTSELQSRGHLVCRLLL